MSLKNTLKTVKFGELVADTLINARFSASAPIAGVTVDTYNIDQMEMLLWESRGQLHEPLKVEKRLDGKLGVLQGFRRYFGLQRFAQNEQCPADIRDALTKIRVIVYEDLTETERLSIVHDHGGRQDLARSEVVASIWTLSYNGFTPKEIIVQKYHDLAKMLGNEDALRKVPTDPKEKEAFLSKTFYPTVNGFYLSVHKAGEYWRNQLMLTLLERDGLLKDGTTLDGVTTGRDPRPQFKVTHDRWRKLEAAWKEDHKPEKGGYEMGNTLPICGPTAKALIESFIAKDKGEKTPDAPGKMMTAKAVKERQGISVTNLERKLLDHVLTGKPVDGLKAAADNVARLEGIDAIAIKSVDRVAANATVSLREMLGQIMHSTPAQFEQFVARFCPTPAATEEVSEQPPAAAEVSNPVPENEPAAA